MAKLKLKNIFKKASNAADKSDGVLQHQPERHTLKKVGIGTGVVGGVGLAANEFAHRNDTPAQSFINRTSDSEFIPEPYVTDDYWDEYNPEFDARRDALFEQRLNSMSNTLPSFEEVTPYRSKNSYPTFDYTPREIRTADYNENFTLNPFKPVRDYTDAVGSAIAAVSPAAGVGIDYANMFSNPFKQEAMMKREQYNEDEKARREQEKFKYDRQSDRFKDDLVLEKLERELANKKHEEDVAKYIERESLDRQAYNDELAEKKRRFDWEVKKRELSDNISKIASDYAKGMIDRDEAMYKMKVAEHNDLIDTKNIVGQEIDIYTALTPITGNNTAEDVVSGETGERLNIDDLNKRELINLSKKLKANAAVSIRNYKPGAILNSLGFVDNPIEVDGTEINGVIGDNIDSSILEDILQVFKNYRILSDRREVNKNFVNDLKALAKKYPSSVFNVMDPDKLSGLPNTTQLIYQHAGLNRCIMRVDRAATGKAKTYLYEVNDDGSISDNPVELGQHLINYYDLPGATDNGGHEE